MNIKEANVRIFNHTQSQIAKSKLLSESVKQSIANQKYYADKDEVGATLGLHAGRVIVTKSSSFDAARKYNNVCVLNFASATNPGGGVTKGSSAQEECLCRCSTLYECLNSAESWKNFYEPHRKHGNALHNDDIIYTPNVYIIKSDSYNNLYQPKSVNVITCAAPNLRETPSNAYNHERGEGVKISDSELFELHKRRAGKILRVAAANGNTNIVLGAFGCGAFRNDPKIVAEAYKAALSDYAYMFDTIEFAVFCKDDTTNYDVFKSVLIG